MCVCVCGGGGGAGLGGKALGRGWGGPEGGGGERSKPVGGGGGGGRWILHQTLHCDRQLILILIQRPAMSAILLFHELWKAKRNAHKPQIWRRRLIRHGMESGSVG